MAEDDPTKKSPAVTDTQLLRQILDKVGGIEGDVKGLRGQMKANADQSLAQHEATRRYVARLATAVRVLWTKVFGSDPPPPADPNDEHFAFAFKENPTEPGKKRATVHVHETETDVDVDVDPNELPLARHISDHDLDIAGLNGRLIAVSSKVNVTADQVGELLDLQKEQMGRNVKPPRSIVQRFADGVAWIFTDREGRKFTLLLIAALGGLVAAVRPQPATVVRYEPAPAAAPLPAPSARSSAGTETWPP